MVDLRQQDRYEEGRDSPWNSGNGADGQREVHGVGKGDGRTTWAASFVKQPAEPSFAVLLRPWIYDQFQGVPGGRTVRSNVDASWMAGETYFHLLHASIPVDRSMEIDGRMEGKLRMMSLGRASPFYVFVRCWKHLRTIESCTDISHWD